MDTNNPVNYGLVDTHTENGIGGGIHHEDDAPKGIMIYAEVDDLQAYLDKAVGLGGTIVMPVTVVPGMVTMAHFAEPQGNVIGLIQSGSDP